MLKKRSGNDENLKKENDFAFIDHLNLCLDFVLFTIIKMNLRYLSV